MRNIFRQMWVSWRLAGYQVDVEMAYRQLAVASFGRALSLDSFMSSRGEQPKLHAFTAACIELGYAASVCAALISEYGVGDPELPMKLARGEDDFDAEANRLGAAEGVAAATAELPIRTLVERYGVIRQPEEMANAHLPPGTPPASPPRSEELPVGLVEAHPTISWQVNVLCPHCNVVSATYPPKAPDLHCLRCGGVFRVPTAKRAS